MTPEQLRSFIPATPMRLWLHSILVVAVAFGSPSAARAQKGTDQVAVLLQRFGVATPPADVVVLLDASGSMMGKYPTVRQAAVDFAKSLTPAERLHLRVFGDVPSEEIRDPNQLPSETFPLERKGTDLGMAIEKALDTLEQDDTGPFQVLFLLTDGLHEPRGHTPYTTNFRDRAWEALRRRAEQLCTRHSVTVYGLGLGQKTNVDVLLDVFPARNVLIQAGGTGDVAGALQQARDRLRRAQLRQALKQEVDQGKVELRLQPARVAGRGEPFQVAVEIRNAYAHLPIHLSSLKLESVQAAPEIECTLAGSPQDHVLAPGQSWRGQIRGVLKARKPGFRIGSSELDFTGSYRVMPAVRFEDQLLLAAVQPGVGEPVVAAPDSLEVDQRLGYGIPAERVIAVSLVIIGLVSTVLLLASRRRSHEKERLATLQRKQEEARRVQGRLAIWQVGESEPENDEHELSNAGTCRWLLRVADRGGLEPVPDGETGPWKVVAQVSGELTNTASEDPKTWKPRYRIEPMPGHTVEYESSPESWANTASLVLCDQDRLKIDNRWLVLYRNERLDTRAVAESRYA